MATDIEIARAATMKPIGEIATRLGIGMDEVSFMGDDLPDLRVMSQVGFSAAPASAHPWVRERVHWRTAASAGQGAAREFCDLLLAAQGRVESLLEDVTRIEGVRVEGNA